MSSTPKGKLKKMKSLDLDNASVFLWIIKRKLKDKKADYSVLNAEIENKLSEKLKKIVKEKFGSCNQLRDYSHLTEDQDDDVLTLNYKETDFPQIFLKIQKGSDNPKVEKTEDLFGTWAYVIEIKHDFQLLTFTKVPETWDLKKKKGLMNLIFIENKFKDLEDNSIFRIQRKIDFFCFEDIIFVLDKKKFETGLNFREGMKANRDEVLKDFEAFGIIDDIEKLRERVGENMKYLRKISMIKNNGYYKNEDFITRLIQVNMKEKWGLKIEANKIIITEDNFNDVLTILNNDRLKSPITEETFDVHVKRSLGRG
ncbi:MAG: DUF4868 domain-containing protein [Candidatus Brocadia sp. AMX2]|uniref:DUF4868 domain-containing protein n=1 Tax=Candidatus Brocadia sinica JPN1 TaxID=1197129 RepID=A0ABQ0JVM2_9BACT|nr:MULTISPECIES: Kiwa anti-phage protein KwaB-like domain-containing protein [Brocadia]MBC6930758.1 DUF4868 domain-containing protein [Candidatus Brocadia sp.]MBL1167727.1 DUF4868 domain-containing protein [Candidatus Brocadia sp. AMX1]NOG41340.1 DUF4868 domain-containing protein [Planctomycetota bacterium]GIK13664.1 MAG: DUF4868 domain-containing protein [Candidatus Brocadia sinica]KAA0245600.1 MAG: DUF4868 domain-containing protein [Candidatus Brocadia sp. AMX2]